MDQESTNHGHGNHLTSLENSLLQSVLLLFHQSVTIKIISVFIQTLADLRLHLVVLNCLIRITWMLEWQLSNQDGLKYEASVLMMTTLKFSTVFRMEPARPSVVFGKKEKVISVISHAASKTAIFSRNVNSMVLLKLFLTVLLSMYGFFRISNTSRFNLPVSVAHQLSAIYQIHLDRRPSTMLRSASSSVVSKSPLLRRPTAVACL